MQLVENFTIERGGTGGLSPRLRKSATKTQPPCRQRAQEFPERKIPRNSCHRIQRLNGGPMSPSLLYKQRFRLT